MLVKTERLPQSRVKLSMTASAAQFNHAFEHELAELSKNVKVPGFRPGKAPAAKAIAQIGRQRVEAAALDHAVSDAYFSDIREAGLIPVQAPTVVITTYTFPTEVSKDDDVALEFTVEVDVAPEISIKGYKDIRISHATAPVVEEDEVEKVIDYLRKQRAQLEPLPADTAAEMGMWADISFNGSVDGVSREDMKSANHPLVLGERTLIPGFEEELIGLKAKEEKTFKITFPDDYGTATLAGKEAEFTVSINELKKMSLPELDEAFASHYGHDTAEQLTTAIRENLHQEKQQESSNKLETEVVDELIALSNFELPVSLVDQELERLFEESKARLNRLQFQWETYLQQTGKTETVLKEEMRVQAEKNVRIGLVLGQLIRDEGIVDSKEAPRQALDRLMAIATANV